MKRSRYVGGILFLLLVGPLLAQATPRSEEWVRQRVRRIKASDTDAWRRIPWADSLTIAAATAKKEDRPMFVFSHEGNIDTGRC
jgi:hypothetical protein